MYHCFIKTIHLQIVYCDHHLQIAFQACSKLYINKYDIHLKYIIILKNVIFMFYRIRVESQVQY